MKPKRTFLLVLTAIVALVFVEMIFVEHHGGLAWFSFPGSHVILGILGGVLLMIFSKLLGKYLLYRKGNYYAD